MRFQELTLVFEWNTLTAQFSLGRIVELLGSQKIPLDQFQLYREPGSFAQFEEKCKSANRDTFLIEGHGMAFDQGRVGNYHVDFIGIKATCRQLDWLNWALKFIEHEGFVMGWLADADYEFWQNARNPLQYEAADRPYSHLPMKSNGLPPPVEQMIIDTSGNPGRRILRDGYIEAVGNIMWLSEKFWKVTGTEKSIVEKAKWLKVIAPKPSVVMIQAAEECFTTDAGEGGEIQRKLRRLLFPSEPISI